MNAFLVIIIRFINGLVALAVVAVGAIALGVVGALVGLIAAALISGVLAIALEIERHLRDIKESLNHLSPDLAELRTRPLPADRDPTPSAPKTPSPWS